MVMMMMMMTTASQEQSWGHKKQRCGVVSLDAELQFGHDMSQHGCWCSSGTIIRYATQMSSFHSDVCDVAEVFPDAQTDGVSPSTVYAQPTPLSLSWNCFATHTHAAACTAVYACHSGYIL